QLIAIGDRPRVGARRNVDRLAAETQAHGRSRRRIVGEVEAGGQLHRFPLARWLQMQLYDQIAARLEAPLRAVGHTMRGLTRRPAEKLSFGVSRVALHAARVAGLGIARVELTRRSRAIDAEVRVVHDARIAGTQLERPPV